MRKILKFILPYIIFIIPISTCLILLINYNLSWHITSGIIFILLICVPIFLVFLLLDLDMYGIKVIEWFEGWIRVYKDIGDMIKCNENIEHIDNNDVEEWEDITDEYLTEMREAPLK